MPGPRKEAAEVRLALSKELLNTSLRPRLSVDRRQQPGGDELGTHIVQQAAATDHMLQACSN